MTATGTHPTRRADLSPADGRRTFLPATESAGQPARETTGAIPKCGAAALGCHWRNSRKRAMNENHQAIQTTRSPVHFSGSRDLAAAAGPAVHKPTGPHF